MTFSAQASIAAFVVAVYVLRKLLLAWGEDRFCSFVDIKHAGTSSPLRRQGQAVIVGASITGILSARICSDHYEDVVLIDAEKCSTDPQVKRTRVKQHDQLHIFLGLMFPTLQKLFPTFEEELRRANGSVVPPQPVVYRGGGIVKLPHKASDWDVRQLYVSREVLEALLRKLLLEQCTNVRAIHGTVTDILLDDDRQTVKSATVRYPNGVSDLLQSSIIIDATGTANGSMRWLKKAGFPEPIRTTYDPAIVYTCFTFQFTPKMIAQYDAANPQYRWSETGHVGACFSADHHSVFMRIDNNRVRTMFQTYTGRGGEPENLADLIAYSKQASYQPWQKDVISVICAHGNEEEVEYTRTKVNIGICYRVAYDSKSMPSNLFPLGDSVLRVNPIFGQGCTKSIVDILTLDRTLRKCRSPIECRRALAYYLDLHYARTDVFWRDTRLQDYACDATIPTVGESSDTGRLHRSWLRFIVRAAQKDQTVGVTLTQVMGALKPFTAFFDPLFVLRCSVVNYVAI